MEGGIHPVLEQNYWQERRDSRLIPLRSCPNDRVHLTHRRAIPVLRVYSVQQPVPESML